MLSAPAPGSQLCKMLLFSCHTIGCAKEQSPVPFVAVGFKWVQAPRARSGCWRWGCSRKGLGSSSCSTAPAAALCCLRAWVGAQITEPRMVLPGRDIKAHPVQCPCPGQGHLPLAQAAPSPIHPSLGDFLILMHNLSESTA